jgi:hypothetical protein
MFLPKLVVAVSPWLALMSSHLVPTVPSLLSQLGAWYSLAACENVRSLPGTLLKEVLMQDNGLAYVAKTGGGGNQSPNTPPADPSRGPGEQNPSQPPPQAPSKGPGEQ